MCPVSGSVVLHSTIALAVGLTDIAANDTSADTIHRQVPPTGLVVVVVGQVPQAREMLEAVVEELILLLALVEHVVVAMLVLILVETEKLEL